MTIIFGPSNQPAMIVVPPGYARTLSVSTPLMHTMAEEGKAWTLPAKIVTPADTNDNNVFHFVNDDNSTFDFHKVVISSDQIGTWTLKTGEAYVSGGSQFTDVRQLAAGSGETQDMTVSHGLIVLSGVPVDTIYMRLGINDPKDILAETEALQMKAATSFALSFQGDTANAANVTITCFNHGLEPWEA